MAAATVDTTASKSTRTVEWLRRVLSPFIDNAAVRAYLVPMTHKATIPSTSVDDVGDIIRLTPKLPAGTHVWEFRGNPSAMDSGGSKTLSYDVVFVNSADSTIVTLVSGSTAGRAGTATDRITNAAVGKYCGEGYIALKITAAAATAAAGTYKWALVFSVGTVQPLASTTSMTDAEA